MELILLSQGANSKVGKKLLCKALKEKNIKDRKLLILVPEQYRLEESLREAFIKIGFAKENIFCNTDLVELQMNDFVYISEGNVFEILQFLRQNHMVEKLRDAVKNEGVIYIGASAGALLVSKDIKAGIDFEQNRVGMTDYRALGLFDGMVIPHYDRRQLNQYLKSSEKAFIKEYKKILSVADEKILILKKGIR